MNRQEILDLLLKDHSHDFLIEHPELYSIDEDIYQWMFEKRDYWNQKIPRIMDGNRRLLEKIKREEPEEAPYYEEFYTEEYIRREAYRFFHQKRRFEKLNCYWMLAMIVTVKHADREFRFALAAVYFSVNLSSQFFKCTVIIRRRKRVFIRHIAELTNIVLYVISKVHKRF